VLTLGIGVSAALLWGVHDLCVRRLSRELDVAASMAVVLIVGSLCLLPPMFFLNEALHTDLRLLMSTAVCGLLFAAATYALWRAYGSGPVRMVAPITAGYPIVSLGLAAAGGETVSAVAWGAVMVVILGVAIVASVEADRQDNYNLRTTAGWSGACAVAFALTFALGQSVMSEQAALPTLLITRLAALAVIVFFLVATAGLRLPPRDALPLLALMGVLDVAALGLVFFAGRFPNASYATVTASLYGVVTILLAGFLLEERLSARQWFGVAVTFAAIGVLGSVVQ